MVTVHHAFGFRFVMFVNDHDPPHVHVFGQGGEAKIDLLANGAAVLVWVRGMSRADQRRMLAEARSRHAILLNAWRTIHGG
jgi:hypothetical protein